MATISSSDLLFATASVMGEPIFNFVGSGISSVADLIHRIKSSSPYSRGMVTLTVRNTSRGWAGSRAFYLGD